MKVKRIVPNIASKDVEAAKRFYCDVLGLEIAMDLGWIVTFKGDATVSPQLSVATQGGPDIGVPDLTIEVDNLDEALKRFARGKITIEYGPVTEPWGVRRFFARAPHGRLLNIMQHAE